MNLKKWANKLLAPAEDPRQTYANTFDRQRELLANVQQALQNVKKTKGRLEDKAAETRAKLPQLEAMARQALIDGNEHSARLRLQRRYHASLQLQAFEQQLREIEREENRLSLTEQRLSGQLTAFFTRQELLAARYSAAEAQVNIGEALSGVSEDLAELDRAMANTERKSEQMQARAAAIDRLVDDGLLELPSIDTLSDINNISLYEPEEEINRQLAALKAQIAPKSESSDVESLSANQQLSA